MKSFHVATVVNRLKSKFLNKDMIMTTIYQLNIFLSNFNSVNDLQTHINDDKCGIIEAPDNIIELEEDVRSKNPKKKHHICSYCQKVYISYTYVINVRYANY